MRGVCRGGGGEGGGGLKGLRGEGGVEGFELVIYFFLEPHIAAYKYKVQRSLSEEYLKKIKTRGPLCPILLS